MSGPKIDLLPQTEAYFRVKYRGPSGNPFFQAVRVESNLKDRVDFMRKQGYVPLEVLHVQTLVTITEAAIP